MSIYTGKLTEQSIKAIHEFLKRATLKGSEVIAFNAVLKELSAFKIDDFDSKRISTKEKDK